MQNFTDIDDKIIRRANEEGVTYDVIAERYIEEFKKDAVGLGVREATVHPRATEHMQEIISSDVFRMTSFNILVVNVTVKGLK